MKNLKLKYKFTIIILLAALPTAVATYLLIKQSSKSIDFAAKEILGSVYLQPLGQMHELLGDHRTAYMSSLVDGANQRPRIKQSITDLVAEMSEKHQALVAELGVESQWEETKASVYALLETEPDKVYMAAKEMHDATYAAINSLISQVADGSNLTVDPDLDSYYLMDAVVMKIPTALEGLSEYQVQFSERSGFIFQATNIFDLQNLAAAHEAAVAPIATAIKLNPELETSLGDKLETFNNNFTVALEALKGYESARTKSGPELQIETFDIAGVALDSGYALFHETNSELHRLLQDRIDLLASERNTMIAFVLATVVAGMLFTMLVSRGITNTITRARNVAEAISQDNLNIDIASAGRDEPGQLMNTLSVMQDKLKARINDERQQSAENGRIKQALDCVSRPVMVAGVDKTIIYTNNAAYEFFDRFEQQLSQDIPGFSSQNIIGQAMTFLGNSSQQNASTSASGSDNEYETIIGGRHVRLVSNPIEDEQGEYLGTVLELQDRTTDVAVEQAVGNDVMGLVDEALKGNLSSQISAEGKPDFLVPVYNGINDMVDVCNHVITKAGEMFKRLADGDLSQLWQTNDARQLDGDFLQLHKDANTTVLQLKEMISTLKSDSAIVSDSASKVLSVNDKLDENMLTASHQAGVVSSAVTSISDNVDTIASAAVQMNASISEIVKNTQRSTSVALEAVSLTKSADTKVTQLSSSSQSIGAMVKVINSIAEQTNLLALNATIEAARAGEAGKGFAVVANEVKELAKETAKATEDISEKIRTIQHDSRSATEGIREIDSIVQQINDLQTDNASAMEQQGATTTEISSSINNVASESSSISGEVNELVEGTDDALKAVQVSKDEVMQLNRVAGNLKAMVERFNLADNEKA